MYPNFNPNQPQGTQPQPFPGQGAFQGQGGPYAGQRMFPGPNGFQGNGGPYGGNFNPGPPGGFQGQNGYQGAAQPMGQMPPQGMGQMPMMPPQGMNQGIPPQGQNPYLSKNLGFGIAR